MVIKNFTKTDIRNYNAFHDSSKYDPESLVIAHQCNCIATNAHGLAETLADKFPYCDIYSNRQPYIVGIPIGNLCHVDDRGKVGTIVTSSQSGQPTIASLLAQYQMGSLQRNYHSHNHQYLDQEYKDMKKMETYELRETWFRSCLQELKCWIISNNNNDDDDDEKQEVISSEKQFKKKKKKITTVALPKWIGCNLAGGNWDNYKKIIHDELEAFGNDHNINICIVSLT